MTYWFLDISENAIKETITEICAVSKQHESGTDNKTKSQTIPSSRFCVLQNSHSHVISPSFVLYIRLGICKQYWVLISSQLFLFLLQVQNRKLESVFLYLFGVKQSHIKARTTIFHRFAWTRCNNTSLNVKSVLEPD